MYCMAWIRMYQYVEWAVGVHNKAINGVLVHCLDMVGTNVHKWKQNTKIRENDMLPKKHIINMFLLGRNTHFFTN
jgi:hypothetical protein